MSRLYKLIERLMDESFKAQDKTFRTLMAALELQARECYAVIESKLAVLN